MLGSLSGALRQHAGSERRLLPRAVRGVSSVVQQMVEFARSQAAGDVDQGVDVLRSGLSMQPAPGDAAGLLLAMAELEGERSNWSEAHSLAAQACSAAAGADEELRAQAGAAAARALLAQGAPPRQGGGGRGGRLRALLVPAAC
jgi:hypothetical protein